jgi:hypothetical protein
MTVWEVWQALLFAAACGLLTRDAIVAVHVLPAENP